MLRCVMILAAVVATATFAAAEDEPIRPGDLVWSRLDSDAPTKRFAFSCDWDGPATLSLKSADFDAFLAVETDEGVPVGEADDGGIETNARFVLQAKRGARYRIVASASKGGAGDFSIEIQKGEVPPLAGSEKDDAAIVFRVQAAERALERGDKPAAAEHRRVEGLRRQTRVQLAEAKAAFESSLELYHEVGDSAREAKVLGHLGFLHRFMEDYRSAFDYQHRRFALATEVGDPAERVKASNALAFAYDALADLPRARRTGERSLALSRAAHERAEELWALNGLATVCLRLGDASKSGAYAKAQLALARETGDRTQEAWARRQLGSVWAHDGDPAKSLRYARGALEIFDQLNNRWAQETVLWDVGAALQLTRDYAQAHDVFVRRLDLDRELGHRDNEIASLERLGQVCLELGEYTRAIDYQQRCLGLARAAHNGAAEAGALEQIGVVADALGDRDAARESLDEALALFQRDGDLRGEARVRADLGVVLGHAGDLAKARDAHEKALELWTNLRDPAQAANVRANLAWTDYLLGRTAQARDEAEAALRLEREGKREPPLALLDTLARIALAEKDLARTEAVLAESQRILERPGTQKLASGGALSVLASLATWSEIEQDVVQLRLAANAGGATLVEEGFRSAGRWKGVALLAGLVEHHRGARSRDAIRLRRERDEALAHRDAILENVSRGVREGMPPADLDALRRDAKSLLDRADELLRVLREVSPRDAGLLLPRGVEADAVRKAAISKGSALVEYAEGVERFYAYVLTETELRRVDLGERDAIDASVEAFLALVSSPGNLGTASAIAEKGRALYEALLAPALRAAGGGIERLVVVPTASLAGLAFEALVVDTRGTGATSTFADLVFVIDQYEVAYGPSSPVLVDLAALGARRLGGKMLVLADPIYPSEPATAEPSAKAGAPRAPSLLGGAKTRSMPAAGEFSRLEKTRNEALAVTRCVVDPNDGKAVTALAALAEKRSGSVSAAGFDLHLGAEASRKRLAASLKSYAVLHLAAHGYVDRESPAKTGIALAFSDKDDGYFTVQDALALDLDANLVVLSACETAQGKVRAGEGLESMARAFMYAGSRGVVASLWQVADTAAAETMEAFYRGALEKDLPPSRSLREAKLSVRRAKATRGVGRVNVGSAPAAAPAESGHPFFWAPFVYMGIPH